MVYTRDSPALDRSSLTGCLWSQGHGVFARGLQGNASSDKALRAGWRSATAKAMLITLGIDTPASKL